MIYLAGSGSSEQRTFMVKIAEFVREQFSEEVYCLFELQIPNAWDYSQEDWAKVVFDKDKEVILKRCDSYIKKFEQNSCYREDFKISVYTDLADFVK